VIEQSGSLAPLSVMDALYNATAEEMLDVLAGQPDADRSILLVAHMPGVAELAEALAAAPVKGGLHFQPGMLAVLTLDVEQWREIHTGCGTIQTWRPP
jgi:phosphohistidine phosphatase SixA